MTDQGGLPALVGLLPPSAGAGMTVGWEAVQEAWELVFPSDFKGFLDLYGGGLSDLDLSVLVPSGL
jgi:hypothetical protein